MDLTINSVNLHLTGRELSHLADALYNALYYTNKSYIEKNKERDNTYGGETIYKMFSYIATRSDQLYLVRSLEISLNIVLEKVLKGS